MKYIKDRINERFQINSDFGNLVLLRKEDTEFHFLLYNTNTKKPIGYIGTYLHVSVDTYPIAGAYASNGYGPFLYECIMTQVFPKGVSLSRDSSTSDDALEVWEKFDKRTDVTKERMYSDELTHKREELSNCDVYDPEKLERIFELEDTRFIYSFGRAKLDQILEIGDRYKMDNNITDEDIEHMSWDLE